MPKRKELSTQAFDLLAHIRRHMEFSQRTFGPRPRAAGVVDHIRKELREIEAAPHDPALDLDINNLQILCHDCNHGKVDWGRTDWRPAGAKQPGETHEPTV